MNAGRPISAAVSASQVARSRDVSRAGRPVPPASDRVSGLVMLPRSGFSPAGQEAFRGERGGFQQRRVVAGQHRHRPRPGTAYPGHDTAGPAGDVGAAGVAQVGADQPGTRAQADQRGGPRTPARCGLGGGEGKVAGDLARRVRSPGPAAGQGRISRVQVRHHLAGGEPQVRPQRPPRRPRQARPVRGEPLGHRRVQ